MKTFFVIAVGAIVGMAGASPVVNGATCKLHAADCITDSECCEGVCQAVTADVFAPEPKAKICFNPGECQDQNQKCLSGSQCCDDGGCDMERGVCGPGFFFVGARRINAACSKESECWSRNCENGFCAPNSDSNLSENGEVCQWDMECAGGWCDPTGEGPAVCNDRTLDPIDPRKW
eukprot:Clim_evm5s243 gene=Clim_evmTU5s243